MKPLKTSISSKPTEIPELHPGERIILQGQGVYKKYHHYGWRPAQSFLTDRRFVLYLRPKIMSEIPLGHIKSLSIERLYCVMRVRDTLCIIYESEAGSRGGRLFFAANHIEIWKKAIFQLSLLKVDPETIEKIAARLDSDGRDILWYLWENRHASISQLSELIDAPSHMHVLFVIRETINPVSEKLIGSPILSFEKSKVHPETGETVLYNWWLIGRQEQCIQSKERLLDVFDENSHIRVIMEVRGVEAPDLRLDFHGDRVTVRCHKIGASLRETLCLPGEVTPANHEMSVKNNLLQIKLMKTKPYASHT